MTDPGQGHLHLLPVPHEEEAGDAVEGRHQEVGQRQVEEEVVGDAPHVPVRQDDPQHDRVAHDRHHDDEREEEGPDDLRRGPQVISGGSEEKHE